MPGSSKSAKLVTKSSPWGTSGRKRIRDHKRDAVLRTAAQIFNVRGYHETSLELVAEELGITRPTVYYYFKNKDEILFECVRMGLKSIEDAAEEVTSRGGTPAERLVAVMHSYAEVMTAEFGTCLIRVGDTPLPPQSRLKLRKLQANIDRRIRGIITEGIEGRFFRPCNPKLAAFAIAGALNSIARWYRPEGPLSASEVAKELADILIATLVPQHKQT